MAEVGFVGLGVMGGGVARRLLAAGHTVYGYNRTRAKAQALVDADATAAGTASIATPSMLAASTRKKTPAMVKRVLGMAPP